MNKIEQLIRRVIKEEKRKLKEFNTEDEIEHLATNLLDHLEGSVPDLPNWRADNRIVKFFRSNSITDGNLATKIYQRASELSRENQPRKSDRRYLNN